LRGGAPGVAPDRGSCRGLAPPRLIPPPPVTRRTAGFPRRGGCVRRRWTRASRLFLMSSLTLAVVAGMLVHGYVARAGAAAALMGPRVPVVVAASGVARGAILRSSQLKVVRMPRAFAPPGAFRDIPRAAGRAALTDLAAGEAVTETRLARVRAGP